MALANSPVWFCPICLNSSPTTRRDPASRTFNNDKLPVYKPGIHFPGWATYPPSPSDSTRTASSYNSFNQLNTRTQFDAPFAVTNFGYDNNGNLLSETTGTQVKSYTWDFRQSIAAGPAARWHHQALRLRCQRAAHAQK